MSGGSRGRRGRGRGSGEDDLDLGGGADRMLEEASALIARADASDPGRALISHGTQGNMLCCMCGARMQYNPTATCGKCLKSRVDVGEDIARTVTMDRCSGCGRYSVPPHHWRSCDHESKELLEICLKKVHGLDKVKLIDASFIWTEPHSKRLKIKVTIHKDMFEGVTLQQSLVVEFIVKSTYCKNCHMVAAEIQWTCVVQVRQKVDSKRTLYLLEQLIIKHRAHTRTVQVKEVPDGIDFFFLHRRDADRFTNFVLSSAPAKLHGVSEQVISNDLNNNKASMRVAISIEIVPICKDDLMCLSKRHHASLGSLGPIVICTGVTTNIKLIDPLTMLEGNLRSDMYFKDRCNPLLTASQMTRYTVIDVEMTGLESASGMLQAEVTLARVADLGVNDVRVTSLTHMGALLSAGDTVCGYDLESANMCEGTGLGQWPRLDHAQVVIFKKEVPEAVRRKRKWKLRALIKQEDQGTYESVHKQRGGEYEQFLQDVEQDAEMRARLNIYKDPQLWRLGEDGRVSDAAGGQDSTSGNGGGDDVEREGEEGVEEMEMLDDLVLGVNDQDSDEEEEQDGEGDDENDD